MRGNHTQKKKERERAQFLILDNVHISQVAEESEPLKCNN